MTSAVEFLDTGTWPRFAARVKRKNGVSGGCCCTGRHFERAEQGGDHRAATTGP